MGLRSVVAVIAFLLSALPASGQALPMPFVGPSGEKKAGQYIWVWHSAKLEVDRSSKIIQAGCPVGYVVLSGGYHIAIDSGGPVITASNPNQALDGWTVEVSPTYRSAASTEVRQIATVTVWATCAPAK
jgi:hypothetical protein